MHGNFRICWRMEQYCDVKIQEMSEKEDVNVMRILKNGNDVCLDSTV